MTDIVLINRVATVKESYNDLIYKLLDKYAFFEVRELLFTNACTPQKIKGSKRIFINKRHVVEVIDVEDVIDDTYELR